MTPKDPNGTNTQRILFLMLTIGIILHTLPRGRLANERLTKAKLLGISIIYYNRNFERILGAF